MKDQKNLPLMIIVEVIVSSLIKLELNFGIQKFYSIYNLPSV